jgi:hypothetical protein
VSRRLENIASPIYRVHRRLLRLPNSDIPKANLRGAKEKSMALVHVSCPGTFFFIPKFWHAQQKANIEMDCKLSEAE